MEPLAAAAATLGVTLVIPTLDEEEAIAGVIGEVPVGTVAEIIVADSGSRDLTRIRASAAGAKVVLLEQRGYGRACAAAAAQAAPGSGIIAFIDGDGSDRADLLPQLLAPIQAGTHDLVIASRTRGHREPGSMSWHQILAGRLAGGGMRLLYGVAYTDMCAFRAIRRDALEALDMREMTYGWNLEMQMKAASGGLRILEIAVPYRRRAGGRSKVAGTLAGTVKAGWRIVVTFGRVALTSRSPRRTVGPILSTRGERRT